jgi:hypothetical protein
MSKQTSIEWLEMELKKLPFIDVLKTFEKAKQMHKEEIIDAFVECWKENMPEGYECKQSAEYYYNETYGGQDA